jgi:uncharacterized membrane protein YphA (DoxX/SURF4 family)
MIAEKPAIAFGWRVFGLGVMALGVTTLVFGDFNPGQRVPAGFPARTVLAYAAGVFLLVAGAAIEWRRTTHWAAGAITAYYALFVIILMNGPQLLAGYSSYGIYEEITLQLAIPLAGLILFATTSNAIDATLAQRLIRAAQLGFGICALVWGGAHFVYMNFTAPLVPKWLPPSQVFWGYFTGVCFLAAGLALLTGVRARLAAILLTVMIAGFLVLANGMTLLAEPNHYNWTEVALSLALVGAAWVLADSLPRTRRPTE